MERGREGVIGEAWKEGGEQGVREGSKEKSGRAAAGGAGGGVAPSSVILQIGRGAGAAGEGLL